jgi:hypothetical protein
MDYDNENRLTYRDITKRAKDSALEYMPDLPKENTIEAWESFLAELDALDVFHIADEEAGSWEWAIYTHYGWKVLCALPLETEQEAESDFFDCWGSEPIESLNDAWDMASRIAFFALVIVMREELESAIAELMELAENQIENLEAV